VNRFHFEKFLAAGNLTDIFCDRLYGPNYDLNVPAHAQFIDSLERLNSILLELGVVKPTMMLAVLSNQAAANPRFWKTLTPEFCVRNPQTLDLSANRQKSQLLANPVKPTTISFRKGGQGEEFLRTGWSYPEDWGTWMVGAEAEIEFPIRAKQGGSDSNNPRGGVYSQTVILPILYIQNCRYGGRRHHLLSA
jgi:hypothetical protein